VKFFSNKKLKSSWGLLESFTKGYIMFLFTSIFFHSCEAWRSIVMNETTFQMVFSVTPLSEKGYANCLYLGDAIPTSFQYK